MDLEIRYRKNYRLRPPAGNIGTLHNSVCQDSADSIHYREQAPLNACLNQFVKQLEALTDDVWKLKNSWCLLASQKWYSMLKYNLMSFA